MGTPRNRPDLVLPSLRRKYRHLPPETFERAQQESMSYLDDPGIRQLIVQTPQSALSTGLAEKLLMGAANLLARTEFEDVLEPIKVAGFLAWVASSAPEDLQWVVERGLKWLGVQRTRKRRGRPRGAKKDSEYYFAFIARLRIIESAGIWKQKQELRRQRPGEWDRVLRGQLKGIASPDVLDRLIQAHSLRSLAIWLVTDQFGAEYDTVQRSIRRYTRLLS